MIHTRQHFSRRPGCAAARSLSRWPRRGACASGAGRGAVPPARTEPDKFLFDKGTEALNDKKWLTAREFFKQVTETYTQSPYRPDAKLGIGDTYLGEGSAEALVLAINEFQEFLSFYPTNRARRLRAVQAGRSRTSGRCGSPQRDQTETRDAIKEFETFVARYPNSSLMPEVKDAAARGARSPQRGRAPGRATSTTASAGIRARSIGSDR